MSLPEKINKLLKNKNKEDVKLATNIIIAKSDNTNIIAFICVLKKNKRFDLLKDISIVRAINDVLTQKVPKVVEDNVNYSMPNILRWALQLFPSKENIDIAKETYITYINHLAEIAVAELVNKNTDTAGEKLISEDEDLPF